MKRNKTIFILIVSGLLLLLTACSQGNNQVQNFSDEIPNEVVSFLTDYFEAFQEGSEKALPYRHWGNETDKEMSYTHPLTILDYKITEAEKVNDNLYAFKILVEDSGMPETMVKNGEYMEIYNFVANIEGTWYVCANQQDVPENLRDGFEPNKYNSGEVIGSIDGIDIIQPSLTQ